jgi:uncharacterized DUF497 family protein
MPRDVYDVLGDPNNETHLIPKSKYGSRPVIIGKDRGGRVLILYLAPVDEIEGIWRCATARKATDNERKKYLR